MKRSAEGREGFIHLYAIEGGVAVAKARIILRGFETKKLEEHAEFLKNLSASPRFRASALKFYQDVA